MTKEEPEKVKHWFVDLGFCVHKWKFVRTHENDFRIVDVCECMLCGKRKAFKVW